MKRRCLEMYPRLLSMILAVLMTNCSKNDNNTPNEPDLKSITAVAQVYGGSKNESAKSVVATVDGGFVLLGHTQSIDGDVINKQNEGFDYWLLKFDAESNLQWSKTYGGTEDDRGNDIIQTNDGGFALLGYSQSMNGDVSENAGAQDYWLAKLDASGNLLWQKSYGFPGKDEGTSLIQTNDLGYLLVGVLDVTASRGQGNRLQTAKHAGGDFWAIKIDVDGKLQWSNYYGGTFTDTPNGVVQTSEGGFLMVGSSDSEDVDISNNRGAYDFWVVHISDSGKLLWEKSFGGAEIDEARAIVATSDGDYLIVGETRSNDADVAFNNGAADVWVVKIDLNGNLIWEKTYGGSGFEAGRDIVTTDDNGFLVAGSSRSVDGDVTSNQGQNDAWIIKLDDKGELQWQKAVGGSQIDFAHAVAQLSNGTIIVVGDSASSDFDIPDNKGFTDVLVIKIRG